MSFLSFEDFDANERQLFYGEMLLNIDDVHAYSHAAAQAQSVKEVVIPSAFGITRNATKKIRRKSFISKYIISCDNTYKSIWDGIIMMFVLYSSFLTAYTVAFDKSSTGTPAFLAVDIIMQICFYVDILLTFLHEYRDPMSLQVIKSPKLIAKQYFKTWFIIDFVAVLPFQYGNKAHALKLFRILRIPRIMRLFDYSKAEALLNLIFANFSPKNRMDYLFAAKFVYRIFRTILIAVILTYFLGCLWYLIVSSSSLQDQTETFFTRYELDRYTDARRMVICCYFILTTLSTVGYGDYTPTSSVEKILAIVIMIMGIALFSYIMGTFNDTVSAYDKQTDIADKSMGVHNWITSFTKFTDGRPVPSELVDKIHKHFQFFWKNDRLSHLHQDDEYFSQLPADLKHELTNFLFNDIFVQFRRFFITHEFRGSSFYDKVVFDLLPCQYEIEDHILKQGDTVNEVYLVKEGNVYIYFKYKERIVGKLFGKGYVFGNYNVFSNTPSKYNYKVLKMDESNQQSTKVITIPKSKLLALLSRYPDILARMTEYAKNSHAALDEMMKNELAKAIRLSKEKVETYDIDKVFANLTDHHEESPHEVAKTKLKGILDNKRLQKAEMKLNYYEALIEQQLDDITKNGHALKKELKGIVDHLRQSTVNIHDYLKSEIPSGSFMHPLNILKNGTPNQTPKHNNQ